MATNTMKAPALIYEATLSGATIPAEETPYYLDVTVGIYVVTVEAQCQTSGGKFDLVLTYGNTTAELIEPADGTWRTARMTEICDIATSVDPRLSVTIRDANDADIKRVFIKAVRIA